MRQANLPLLILASLLVCSPYLLPNYPLRRSEGLDYTFFPLFHFASDLPASLVDFWNHFLGIGSPWMLPNGPNYFPLLFLFPRLPLYTAVFLVVSLHLAIGAYFFDAIGRRFGLSSPTRLVGGLSFVLSPSLEYLFQSDAPCGFITWALLPVAIYYALLLVDEERDRIGTALKLGFVIGYTFLNGHPGIQVCHLAILGIVLSARRPTRTWPYCLLAGLVALCIAADEAGFLIHELSLFPPSLPRLKDSISYDPLYLIWSYFLRPVPYSFMGFAEVIQQVAYSRALSFGPAFGIFALAEARKLSGPRQGSLLVGFFASVVLMLLPTRLLPSIFSANWCFRDPAICFGILLAMKFVDEIRWKNFFLASQMVAITWSSFCQTFGGYWNPGARPFTVRQYNDLGGKQNRFVSVVSENLVASGSRRFLFSSGASFLVDREYLVDIGAVTNVGILWGLSEVSFVAKGVSFDGVRKSQSVPYGAILGDRFEDWSLTKGSIDWTIQDQKRLDLLDVGVIVATPDEKVTAPGLRLITTLIGKEAALSIYRNESTGRRIGFFANDGPVTNRKDCLEDNFVCLDLDSVGTLPSPRSLTISLERDGFHLGMASEETAKTLVLSSLYRSEWEAYERDRKTPLAVGSWHGLVSVSVPAGTTGIELRYRPYRQWMARCLTWLSLLAFVIWFATRFRRMWRASP